MASGSLNPTFLFDAPLPLDGARGADILVCGRHFTVDPSGALYWPGEKTLVISDLHLEQGAAAAGKDQLLPPYDTRSTLRRLAGLIDRFDPDRVIALGEIFHDAKAAERLRQKDRERLCILRQGREWYWISGNRDPELPGWLGGIICPALTLDGIKFCHEPASGAKTHEVAGHLHPAARLTRRGKAVRRKCFISNGDRLVIPAFGAYTGGLNVLEKAFVEVFPGGDFHVWMLGKKDVYPVSKPQLLGD